MQHLRNHSGHRSRRATPSQAMLNLPAAWQFSRGEGQLVAVIDTGCAAGPAAAQRRSRRRLRGDDRRPDRLRRARNPGCRDHRRPAARRRGRLLGRRTRRAGAVHQGDVGQVLAADAGRRSAAGAGVPRRGDAGPGDRACGRPRRPGDQHLRDNLRARRSARRPGRAGRGDPVCGGGQGRGDRGGRGQHRADRIGRPAERRASPIRSPIWAVPTIRGTGPASRRSPSRRGGSRTCCRRLR